MCALVVKYLSAYNTCNQHKPKPTMNDAGNMTALLWPSSPEPPRRTNLRHSGHLLLPKRIHDSPAVDLHCGPSLLPIRSLPHPPRPQAHLIQQHFHHRNKPRLQRSTPQCDLCIFRCPGDPRSQEVQVEQLRKHQPERRLVAPRRGRHVAGDRERRGVEYRPQRGIKRPAAAGSRRRVPAWFRPMRVGRRSG